MGIYCLTLTISSAVSNLLILETSNRPIMTAEAQHFQIL